ncbi:MAG TPA: UMP kinase [Methanosarcinaceae archaeon]|nr:UMP kinase [Methanosarcinaceae archaeon]
MLVVISVGGSILAKDLNPDSFISYANALSTLAKEHRLVVVTGGGVAARNYINVARSVGANEVVCDFIGIDVTRLNAQLLISALGNDAFPEPPRTYKDAGAALTSSKIVVMGGVIPGQTTDAVSAILAEYLNADLMLIATSVDGVYSADPTTDPDAIRFEKMTAKELVNVVMSTEMKAGSKSPVDPLAAKIIERCGIETIVMDGSDPTAVSDVIMQEGVESEPVKGLHRRTRITGTR